MNIMPLLRRGLPFCIFCLLAPFTASARLDAVNLRCEYRENPLGIDAAPPRLSWEPASAERAQKQTAYHILAASSPEKLRKNVGDLWDSGRVASGESVHVLYRGRPLASGQRCFWKVRIWDASGAASAWSREAWWEMGLLKPADWSAQWINDGKPLPTKDDDFYRDDPAPLFRKEFRLDKPVRRARLHISGLGYYEASLNGSRVGDHVLDPGWTKYSRRVFYSTYDVTEQVRRGSNCLGVMLGNGWYHPLPLRMWGKYNVRDALPTGRPRLIAQLNVEFADGSRAVIASDPGWKTAEGPVLRNSVYLGETYDARKEIPGWNLPGFDDSQWRAAAPATEPIGPLQSQPQPPIRVIGSLPAAALTQPKPGVHIFDLGQNFAGVARLKLYAPPGARITMRYGELLYPDGTLNPMTGVCGQIKGQHQNASVNGPPAVAWQADTYIAKGGGEEIYTPRFTFHGFRYVEVTGFPGDPTPDAVTGLPMSADVEDAGEFECSNERLNAIQQMVRRTFLSNLFSVQSDCPHREKFGYGGDIAVSCDAFMLNYNMAQFYAKTARDWADSVRPDGMFTDTAPDIGMLYCGVPWAIANPLLQLRLKQYYGEQRLMEEQFPMARHWLDLVASQTPGNIITNGLNDHESLVPTPPALSTPIYCESARMLSRITSQLGLAAESRRYADLAEQIRTAYLAHARRPDGLFEPGTQAAQIFALGFDIVPAADRPALLDALVQSIRTNNNRFTTGIFGTRYLPELLCREGRADVAFDLVNHTNCPGWGYMLEHGATTLWEHWQGSDNTYSHNHPMFGSVSQWFYNWLGGIQPAPDASGFDRIIIRPQIVGDLSWVQCRHRSIRGEIASRWQRKDGGITMEISIPANTTAEVFVPAAQDAPVLERGKPADKAAGVQFLRREKDAAVYRIGSGQYVFTARLRTP